MPDDRRWALVVGAAGYKKFKRLSWAGFDATEFTQSLVTHLNFDRNRIVLLSDDESSDADLEPTRSDIFHALGLFSTGRLFAERKIDPITEDDLLVFYFSGHGLRTDEGEQFLLPVEASDVNVPSTSVPLEEVVTAIDQLPCRHKVLFIDACRADLEEATGAKGPVSTEGFGRREDPDRPGLAIFYSCDPKQRSYEVEDLKHGTFTYELLQAVTHEGINTLAELDDYLTSRVPRLNVQHGKEPQQPFSVWNPRDMLELRLFELLREKGVSDNDELIAMANELYEREKIDEDWFIKLQGVWDEEHVINPRAKKAILRRFHAGDMAFDQFQRRWLYSEKHIPSVRPPKPAVGVPAPNGGRVSSPAAVGQDATRDGDE
jgi:hypothetical protein